MNEMAMEVEAEASSSTSPHRMRITSGGQVSGYVNFALTFLKENPDRALVLHTLPPSNAGNTSKADKASSLNPALLATPKLVSVVEKIKREYMAYVNTDSIGKGKNKAVGIWQYTESGTLESGTEELGLDSILEGRTKPKMKHRPFLQITLSTRPLGLEEGLKGRNVTCQYMMVRRKKSTSKRNTDAGPVASKDGDGDGTNESTVQVKVGKMDPKSKGEKRKSEGSQGSGLDATRGGKKRKK